MANKTILNRIATASLVLCLGFSLGCGESNVVSPTSEAQTLNQATTQNERPAFHLVDAIFDVNGEFETGKINLSQEEFGYLFLWVKKGGLFIVGIDPISLALKGGQFKDNQLTIDLNGNLIVATSEGEHLFDDFQNRTAYVVHVPEFQMFRPDVRPSDLVVGLVHDFDQIPGWAN